MLLLISLCKIDKSRSSTHFRGALPSLSLCGETPRKPPGTANSGPMLASASLHAVPRVTKPSKEPPRRTP